MAGLMGEKKPGDDSIQKRDTPFADDRLNQLLDQAQNQNNSSQNDSSIRPLTHNLLIDNANL